jgi:hypothetical protein
MIEENYLKNEKRAKQSKFFAHSHHDHGHRASSAQTKLLDETLYDSACTSLYDSASKASCHVSTISDYSSISSSSPLYQLLLFYNGNSASNEAVRAPIPTRTTILRAISRHLPNQHPLRPTRLLTAMN